LGGRTAARAVFSEVADMLSRQKAYQFLGARNLAVMSTVTESGEPEAALINYAVTRDLELIFETLQTSRKYANLCRSPKAALVMGFAGECETCQYEGIVDRPDEYLMQPLLETYFAARPEGLEHRGWPNLIYLRIRPTWIRISNYSRNWKVEELDLRNRADELRTHTLLPLPERVD
jgi:pyridoxine/pyridoxamine 5'-phosphate oxidase